MEIEEIIANTQCYFVPTIFEEKNTFYRIGRRQWVKFLCDVKIICDLLSFDFISQLNKLKP